MFRTISEPTLRLSRRSLLISSAAATALLALPGNQSGSGALAAQTPTAGSGVFFDPSFVHDISATFDQDEYDAVIATYSETGEKEWLSATVTIDGQIFEEVGLRLKGNSSLMSLREEFGQPGDGNPANAQPVMGFGIEGGTPTAGNEVGGAVMQGGPGVEISADEPQGLPWLVRLDRFVDDQNLNGLYEFVIRSNNSETALNEALALDLLAEAGLASQAAAYIRFSTNDSDPRLRIAIENPDDVWLAAHFERRRTPSSSRKPKAIGVIATRTGSRMSNRSISKRAEAMTTLRTTPRLSRSSTSSITATMPRSSPIYRCGSTPSNSRSTRR